MADKQKAISAINVPLRTDITGFGAGLKSAANQVDKFYSGVSKTLSNSPFGKAAKSVADFGKGLSALSKSVVAPLKPIADGIGNIGKQARTGLVDVLKLGTGLAALAVAGLATVAAFATGGLKRIGELGDQALQIGIASDKLSELQFAARATGASAEDLNGFLKGLTETIHGSIGVINPASEAFKRLGTSAEELNGLTVDQQFDKLKKGFDALPDAASKASAAVAIGGEAGLKLFKLLGMGAKEFEALKQKSKDSGFTVKPEDLAKVQAANGAIAQIGMTIDGVVNQLTIALAPAVTYISGLFTDWFASVTKDSKFFDQMIDGFIGGFGKLADTAVGISLLFRDVFASIGKAIGDATLWVSNLVAAIASVVPGMEGVADKIGTIGIKIKGFANDQATASVKAREAFEKSKPSESITRAYDNFKKTTEESAKATAKNTQATQQAATANTPLMKSVTDLKQAFAVAIADSGLTAEQKQIAALKREGASLTDIIDLSMKANKVREAGKRDSLAEDLRESTKLPIEKLGEDLDRINTLYKQGRITQTQALRGAAQKTQESGLGGPPKLAGALDSNSIEGRSYLLSQMGRIDTDPVAIAKQGLALTGQGNNYLSKILNALTGQTQDVVYGY
jgi:hypothetical protein